MSPCHRQIRIEDFALPGKHVLRSSEPLISDQPGVPARSLRIVGSLNRALAIWDRIGRIGYVALSLLIIAAR